jgi:hypothetical protein
MTIPDSIKPFLVRIPGVRFDCPGCNGEQFLRRREIEGADPLICPDPNCDQELESWRPLFVRALQRGDAQLRIWLNEGMPLVDDHLV